MGNRVKSLRAIRTVLRSDARMNKLLAWTSSCKTGGILRVRGAVGSLSAFLIAEMLDTKPVLMCVCPSHEHASYLFSDLTQILGGAQESQLLYYPHTDLHPYDKEQVADSTFLVQRADVLQRLKDGFEGILVTGAEALQERVPSPEEVKKSVLVLDIGDTTGPDLLMEILMEQGFEVVSYVQHPGEMARRGGLLDVFPYSGNYPVRLEFFGDELDTIREFDVTTQRSVSRLTQVRIVPNLELSTTNAHESIFLHLPKDALVVSVEEQLILDTIENGYDRAKQAYQKRIEEGVERLELPEKKYLNALSLEKAWRAFPRVRFGVYAVEQGDEREIMFKSSPQPDFNGKIHFVRKRLETNKMNGWETVMLCDSRGQEIRLQELLDPASVREKAGGKSRFQPVETEEDWEQDDQKASRLSFLLDPLHEGFEVPELKLAVYTDHQIFNRYHRPSVRKQKQRYGGFSLRELMNLNPGDFVTHIDYGIGRYAGLQLIEVRGKQQEAVKLYFRDEDVLYVSVNALHKLHRYTGKEGYQPRLSKIGTGEWERIKSSTKKKVKDIARDLIKLYAERQKSQGFAFALDSVWSRELEASFEFEDTPDQAKSWEDVRGDMEKRMPMDRLICGDVGFGKTEIAVRAAFKAVQDGKQVAVLVPTTILAAQHFKTFSERLAQFPVTVEQLSRFRTDAEQKEILKRLKEGRLDIVIGTHRLAAKKMEIPNLGLLIIDEEQRFGVAVKERLRQLKSNVDTLTLTATPIPRTLQFSLMGARDLSYINTPPPNRQPIQTEIHTFDKNLIRDAILYETGRGGQVFFIHNRVQSIEEMAATIRQLVPNVRIKTAHGQMNADELEKVMMDFMTKKFEVLLSTNIVESGLDVSNANTMIINHAERFGLAELHQLRGRVGRSNRKAFCYLLVPSVRTLTKEAKQRLQAVEQFSDLGSGLNIAMRDLDIRGAGNLLGGEQSGFIADVGYETYQRILEEAVAELKQDEFGELFEQQDAPPRPLTETQIDLDVDALIPEFYVEDRVERLNLYRLLSEAKTPDQIEEIREEWRDRFGVLPEDAENLLVVVKMKLQIEPLRLPKVQFKNQRLFLSMPPQEDKFFYDRFFKKLLAQIANLPNRYVLKEKEGKLRVIIQSVDTLEAAQRIVEQLTHNFSTSEGRP